ncbi:MAG TPA: BTAD domain-containing putative transcriptional regulator, partial [Chthonomonadaceae bacterium]|nr:BTAD domain-containing putative transcriptional regulator [Chthonomonadaceae bacterium]
MATHLRIELFGGLRVLQGEQVITRFSTHKTAALLAYLAFFRKHAHPRETLIEMLWPECEPDAGRNRLSTALSSLRHQLEPPATPPGTLLLADRTSVHLNPEAFTTDVADFDAALQAARQTADERQRMQHLIQAVRLYGGELLPGYYEEWVLTRQQQYASRYFTALRHLTAHLAKEGQIEEALEYARQAVGAEPAHEEAHLVLMRLLYASGQAEAALGQYRELERRLQEQLGQSPSATARRLAQQMAAAPPSAPPPTPPLMAIPTPIATAPEAMLSPLPTGTVTLLLTSLGRLQGPERGVLGIPAEPLADFRARCRRLISVHGGREQREEGGAFDLVFSRASDALMCVLTMQRVLAEASETLSLRAALDVGEISSKEGEGYRTLHDRAMRLLLAGHGGQILCSESAVVLLRRDLEAGLRLNDLGAFRFAGVSSPERVFSVEYPGISSAPFPPLRAAPAHTGHLPLQRTRFFGR